MSYEIVPYTPELESRVARLQTQLWSSDPARNAAFLRWKYTDNPFLGDDLIRLARCERQIVAMRGMVGAVWEVDDGATRHLLPTGDDLVVAPEHRNRGAASQIMKASLRAGAERGFPFAVSLGATPTTFTTSLAVGWRSAGSYRSVWRNPPAVPTLWRWRERVRAKPWFGPLSLLRRALTFSRPFAALDRHLTSIGGRIVIRREPRPREMADLVARLPWTGRIRRVRDADYLAWRFRSPLHEYRFLFHDDGGLRGYLVLERYLSDRADPSCVGIADWEASDDTVRAELLETALRYGRFRRLHTWSVSFPETLRVMLHDHGLQAAPETTVRERSSGLLVRRLGEAPKDEPWRLGSRNLLDIADWDLRLLYLP